MNEWWTASELAGMPGMPSRPQEVSRRARNEEWLSRKRQGRGGGREYHISNFPKTTRQALARRWQREQASVVESPHRDEVDQAIAESRRRAAREQSLVEYQRLSHRARARADARAEVLSAWQDYRDEHGLGVEASKHEFARLYSAGEITVEPWVRDVVPSFDVRTLYRWRRAYERDGIVALAGSYRYKRACTIDAQPELREFVLAVLTDKPHASAKHIYRAAEARFRDRDDVELPSKRSVERWVSAWKQKNKALFSAIANPDEWRSKYRPAAGRADADVHRLHQLWELDSTIADVELADGRHALIGAIDVYSRRPMLRVAKTSNSTEIAAITRRALLDWGVPEAVKTDEGADYTSHQTRRVFADLEVEQIECLPFHPEQKPYIERFFKTFAHDIVELLPGFVGHNVAEREAIRARKSFAERLTDPNQVVEIHLTADELQSIADEWIENEYMHRPHRGLNGRTPWEVVAAWDQPIRTIEDERALDVLLSDGGARTVRKACVWVANVDYIVADPKAAKSGMRVHYRCDPHDMGVIYLYDDVGGEFLCAAKNPELAGESRAELSAEVRKRATKYTNQAKQEYKRSARRANAGNVWREVLDDARSQAGNVAMFPKQSETHTAHGLEQAGRAAEERDTSEAADVVDADRFAEWRREQDRKEAEQQQEQQARRFFRDEHDRARYIFEQRLEREITPEESAYLERYKGDYPRAYQRLVSLYMDRSQKDGPAVGAGPMNP